MNRGSGSLGVLAAAAGSLLLGACGSDSTEPVAVASVTVSPATETVTVGDTSRLIATVKDAGSHVLTDRVVTWTSSSPAVATISTTGLVTGVTANAVAVTITATSEGVSGSATIIVMAPVPTVSYASVGAGTYHSCGRTTAGAGYCWGDDRFGQLGDSNTINAPAPVALAGGLSFALVSVGGVNSCGLTAGGAAYCWGADVSGALGAGAPGPQTCTGPEGSYPCSHRPLAVAGGLVFGSLSANWGLVCALAAGGAAHCWGDNSFGALGVGGDTATLATCINGSPCSRTPRPVADVLGFTALGVGTWHVCALTPSGAAYCWGDDRFGQLGLAADTAPERCDSSPLGGAIGPCSRTPLPVSGGLTFTRLSVGVAHSCGLATDGAWYCWGVNHFGQLGNGITGPDVCTVSAGDYPCSRQPVAVAGTVTFTIVFGGQRHSCGVTSAGVAYCWGDNNGGKVGDGTTTNTLTPVAVAGGLRFSNLSPYYYHTCGLTTAGVAYCWGPNTYGNLGDGTTNNSSTPVRVAGQTGTAASAAASRTGPVERRRLLPPTLRPPLP